MQCAPIMRANLSSRSIVVRRPIIRPLEKKTKTQSSGGTVHAAWTTRSAGRMRCAWSHAGRRLMPNVAEILSPRRVSSGRQLTRREVSAATQSAAARPSRATLRLPICPVPTVWAVRSETRSMGVVLTHVETTELTHGGTDTRRLDASGTQTRSMGPETRGTAASDRERRCVYPDVRSRQPRLRLSRLTPPMNLRLGS